MDAAMSTYIVDANPSPPSTGVYQACVDLFSALPFELQPPGLPRANSTASDIALFVDKYPIVSFDPSNRLYELIDLVSKEFTQSGVMYEKTYITSRATQESSHTPSSTRDPNVLIVYIDHDNKGINSTVNRDSVEVTGTLVYNLASCCCLDEANKYVVYKDISGKMHPKTLCALYTCPDCKLDYSIDMHMPVKPRGTTGSEDSIDAVDAVISCIAAIPYQSCIPMKLTGIVYELHRNAVDFLDIAKFAERTKMITLKKLMSDPITNRSTASIMDVLTKNTAGIVKYNSDKDIVPTGDNNPNVMWVQNKEWKTKKARPYTLKTTKPTVSYRLVAYTISERLHETAVVNYRNKWYIVRPGQPVKLRTSQNSTGMAPVAKMYVYIRERSDKKAGCVNMQPQDDQSSPASFGTHVWIAECCETPNCDCASDELPVSEIETKLASHMWISETEEIVSHPWMSKPKDPATKIVPELPSHPWMSEPEETATKIVPELPSHPWMSEPKEYPEPDQWEDNASDDEMRALGGKAPN